MKTHNNRNEIPEMPACESPTTVRIRGKRTIQGEVELHDKAWANRCVRLENDGCTWYGQADDDGRVRLRIDETSVPPDVEIV